MTTTFEQTRVEALRRRPNGSTAASSSAAFQEPSTVQSAVPKRRVPHPPLGGGIGPSRGKPHPRSRPRRLVDRRSTGSPRPARPASKARSERLSEPAARNRRLLVGTKLEAIGPMSGRRMPLFQPSRRFGLPSSLKRRGPRLIVDEFVTFWEIAHRVLQAVPAWDPFTTS